jgi:hypothetical protein
MDTIKKVHVIFKTHLDIGFTHLAEHVIQQYMHEYIPKAIALSEQLEAEGGKVRFVWTTGSWLIRKYLDDAIGAKRKAMEIAIQKGYIVWHGLPFTTHSELMDPALFRYALSISHELDIEFGKQTIAAKMTDVPGHTLSMVPYMHAAGIQYLHLGVNPASQRPDVPRLFRWQAEDGSEIIVNYAGNYGEPVEVEGLDELLVFAHTGDNCGPPSAEEIREQFREIQDRYPNAEVAASSLDSFADQLASVREHLPIVYEEIGDTWIHGASTDPLKLAQLRELMRLRKEWLADGSMSEKSKEYKEMSDAMLLVTEHTWGLDVKKWLPDFRNYAKTAFHKARIKDEIDLDDLPAKFSYIGSFAMNEFDKHSSDLFTAEQRRRTYSMLERSWEEQRQYVKQAVSSLEREKQAQAERALQWLIPTKTDGGSYESFSPNEVYRSGDFQFAFHTNGALMHLEDRNGKRWVEKDHPFGLYAYETFGKEDYDRYFRSYMQNLPVTHPWADADFNKPGFEFVRPLPSYQLFHPVATEMIRNRGAESDIYLIRLRMPAQAHECYGAPKELEIKYTFQQPGWIDITLQWFGKEANRLPEASWFGCGLKVNNPNLWMMDKLGQAVSPLRVVKDGNRNLHALGYGVSYEGADGLAVIQSLDSALAAPGQKRLLQFDNTFASLEHGWQFNLHNNIWGTNFPMWYGEDGKFRFRLQLKSHIK